MFTDHTVISAAAEAAFSGFASLLKFHIWHLAFECHQWETMRKDKSLLRNSLRVHNHTTPHHRHRDYSLNGVKNIINRTVNVTAAWISQCVT